MNIQARHNPEHFERNFVGGDWVFSREGYGFDIYDPSDSGVIAAVPLSSRFDVARTVEIACASLADWSATPLADRIATVECAVAFIRRDLDEIVNIEARDTGAPARYLRAQIARATEYVEMLLNDEKLAQGILEGDPAGVIGMILSWSGPFALACREALPALVAGHTIVAKPSLKAPLSSVLLAEILHEAGLRSGVFNLVQGTGMDVGAALAGQRALSHLWFQGSHRTAKSITRATSVTSAELRLCLRRPNLTIVDEGADLQTAADVIMAEALLNTGVAGYGGQVVHANSAIYKPLMVLLERQIDEIRYGLSTDAETSVGPMINEAYRTARQAALDQMEAQGAFVRWRALAPDARMERMGWFASPTILLVHKYDQHQAIDTPLGPTIITQSLPGCSEWMSKGLREGGWNSCCTFNASGIIAQDFYGAGFRKP